MVSRAPPPGAIIKNRYWETKNIVDQGGRGRPSPAGRKLLLCLVARHLDYSLYRGMCRVVPLGECKGIAPHRSRSAQARRRTSRVEIDSARSSHDRSIERVHPRASGYYVRYVRASSTVLQLVVAAESLTVPEGT